MRLSIRVQGVIWIISYLGLVVLSIYSLKTSSFSEPPWYLLGGFCLLVLEYSITKDFYKKFIQAWHEIWLKFINLFLPESKKRQLK